MSLNKTLDRLFAEIRRETRRNPEFADRLDAVLRAHNSRREVDESLIEEAAISSPVHGGSGSGEAADEGGGIGPSARRPLTQSAPQSDSSPVKDGGAKAPALNPVGLFQREGEDALASALEDQDRDALIALVNEHNLDPGGEADDLDRDALAAHVVAQAKRRAQRDSKLFDY